MRSLTRTRTLRLAHARYQYLKVLKDAKLLVRAGTSRSRGAAPGTRRGTRAAKTLRLMGASKQPGEKGGREKRGKRGKRGPLTETQAHILWSKCTKLAGHERAEELSFKDFLLLMQMVAMEMYPDEAVPGVALQVTPRACGRAPL